MINLVAALALCGCGDDDAPDDGGSAARSGSDAASGGKGGSGGTAGGKAAGSGGNNTSAGDEVDGGAAGGGGDEEAGRGGSNAGAGGEGGSALYALSIAVFDPEWNRTVYMHLSDSLDLGDSIDPEKDRGFPGVANMAAVGGQLLVSNGEAPSITAFDISDDFEWTEGKSVSFAGYPLEDNANFYYQFTYDENTSVLPFEATSRIVWDPSEMTITEALEDTQVPLTKEGLPVRVGGNRAGIQFEGPIRQSFYYTDDKFFAFAQDTVIAIYDEKTQAELSTVTIPCPAVTTATLDEDGYTYYSSWEFQGTRALFGEGPEPCFARLKPDLTLDEEWTTDLRQITEGRYVNNLLYIGDGLAVGNVLYHEKIEADWEAGYDADVADAINKDGEHWRLWQFDLKNGTGKPIEGIDLPVNGNSSFTFIEGRKFLFANYENWARTRIYELSDDGVATVFLDTKGAVSKWVRVR